MSIELTWPVSGGSGSGGGGSSTASGSGRGRSASRGSGLVRPITRIPSGDFDNDSGIREIMSCVGQSFGTRRGSLPWRMDFGSDLERLRHKANTPILAETARHFCEDALIRDEPRAKVVSVSKDVRRPGEDSVVPLLVKVAAGGISEVFRVLT